MKNDIAEVEADAQIEDLGRRKMKPENSKEAPETGVGRFSDWLIENAGSLSPDFEIDD